MNVRAALVHGLYGAVALTITVPGMAQEAPVPAASAPLPGYTIPAPRFDAWKRTSLYVPARDGTKLAVDVYRPTVKGVVTSERLPVIMQMTPYHRREGMPDKAHAGLPEALIKQGYVVVSMDIRGRGASFGETRTLNIDDSARTDLYDVVEWTAAQPWSSGRTGSIGCSYVGQTQLYAASARPPHLTTMAPGSFSIDTYPNFMVNGIEQIAFFSFFDKRQYGLDVIDPGSAVDDDKDGSQRALASAEHKRAWDAGLPLIPKIRQMQPFRNDVSPDGRFARPLLETYMMFPDMASAGISTYQISGWQDFAVDQALFFFGMAERAGMKQRLIIGPRHHCGWYGAPEYDSTAGHIRWFDHELKSVQNGAMDGPVLTYFVNGAPPEQAWRTSDRWPVAGTTPQTLRFGGRMKTSAEGQLMPADRAVDGRYTYTARYDTTSSGIATRFNLFEKPSNVDPANLDKGAVLFTSDAMTEDSEIIGYPILNLWISSSATDQDFFFYLESVDPSGKAEFIGDGAIRASNRATRKPPYETFGMPWHSGLRADQKPLTPGKAERLDVALFPLAQRVPKGNRLRLAITNFDKGNFATPVLTPAPKVTLYFDKDHPSSLTLPIAPAR